MNRETKRINSAKDLRVYRKAYALAMEIFNISKQWPSEIGGQETDDRRQLTEDRGQRSEDGRRKIVISNQ